MRRDHRRSARRFRGAGERLGDGDSPAASPATSRTGLTISACPAGSPGRGSTRAPTAERRSAQPDAGAHRRRLPAAAAPCRAMASLSARPEPASLSPVRTWWRSSFGSMAPQFFDEILDGSGLCSRSQVFSREALASWCAGCRQLRQFWRPARPARAVGTAKSRTDRRAGPHAGFRHGRRRPLALVRRDAAAADDEEHFARVLLNRYGVVFWRLIEREAGRCRPWRDLLRVFRRLEASGEIRGGARGRLFRRRAVRIARRVGRCCARPGGRPSLAELVALPPPIRSTSQASSRRAQNRGVDRQPRASTATACRSRCSPRRGAILETPISQRMGAAKSPAARGSRRPVCWSLPDRPCRRNPMLIAEFVNLHPV